MEEKYGGGLTDHILRVNGEAMIITEEDESSSFPEEENGGESSVDINNIKYDWQFQNNVPLIVDDFGDPFSNFQDPLLLLLHDHDHDIQTQDSRLFFNNNNNNNSDIDSSNSCSIINLAAAVPVPKIDDDGDQEELIIRRPRPPTNNLFARMFQISPPKRAAVVALQRGLKSPFLAAVNDPMMNSCCNSKVDKGGLHLQQISSPPSNAGIKRRLEESLHTMLLL